FIFEAEDGILDRTVTGVQTCALPIYPGDAKGRSRFGRLPGRGHAPVRGALARETAERDRRAGRALPLLVGGSQSFKVGRVGVALDRKSTRLNSSHRTTSYAVFCLKKK